MDVGIYVTSLRVLKNLLLIGDAVKSVMFVAFQVRVSLPFRVPSTLSDVMVTWLGGPIQTHLACQGYRNPGGD